MRFLAPWRPQLLSVLRIMAGLLFLQHGTTKHLGFPASAMNDVATFSMGGIAGLFELVGGALLVVGLFTRPVAFVLSGVMAAAYFIAHAPQGFYPLLNGGELAALYCFTFLYLSAAGGGAWSLDRLLNKQDSA
ncbi:MAG: DoxX family protein [Rhodovibrionaceae bacterium]